MIGSSNEPAFTRVCDSQIAGLYGVRLRSVPTFFLTDDHDTFENDEGTDQLMTLPPDKPNIEAGRCTQLLYYPEFLPDPTRSPWLAGSSAPDRAAGVAESFGTLRWGRLLEALLYDTKRYCTLKGIHAGMVPPAVERWLLARTAAEETHHLLHIPSTPLGWSAGKLGEWYPDLLLPDGTLGTDKPKPFWQPGWWTQHQRLVKALHGQKHRAPIIVQGDLHAAGVGLLHRSGSVALKENPIHLVLTGPLGTGDFGYPSFVRGIGSSPSSQVGLDEALKPMEKNGFTIIDVTPERVTFQLFTWRPPQPVGEIDTMKPTFTYEVKRRDG